MTSMALNKALLTLATPLKLRMPSVTVTEKVRSYAMNCPPAEAKMSRFYRTVAPSASTLKTRWPLELKLRSQNLKRTT